MEDEILRHIAPVCPWRDTLHWFDTVDSTNTRAKALARDGAPHGTVLIAGSQTGGRGRLGRSFSSPTGLGVYLSVILRPGCAPDALMHLTCAAAVAACKAVENAANLCPQIKWTNDLVCEKKKLGGILTELSVDGKTGLIDWAIVGIGINCLQKPEDFPAQLRDMAVSVRQLTSAPCSPARLAAALTEALFQMDAGLLSAKKQLMDDYRKRCMTLGKQIVILQGDTVRHATALDLDENGGLLVRYDDGQCQTVCSGEVSIRGMYGYL